MQHLHAVVVLEARIIAGGQAEPPITVRDLSVENLSLLLFRWPSRPSHTVGTPAVIVTFSALEQLVQALAVEPRAGKHQLGADQGRQA